MHGKKIRVIREMRGLSQENLASQLGIAQNTLSKIETNQSKLESEMLLKIAVTLGISPMDILSDQPVIINFNSNKAIQQSTGSFDALVASQKELFEKIIAAKDNEITHLTQIVDNLISRK